MIGFQRPQWPYASWNDKITPINEHWNEEDDEDGNSPLKDLLNYFEPELECATKDTNQKMFEDIFRIIQQTADEIKTKYTFFERCYVKAVGSFMEDTKIGDADEFDFALVLPYFGTCSVLECIFVRNESLLDSHPEFIRAIKDLSEEYDPLTVYANLLQFFKNIWTVHMKKNIPAEWKLPENGVHDGSENESSIAATYHLIRKKDSFTVDIDVCFWTPIPKELLMEGGLKCLEETSEYLVANCLDEEGLVYAVLGKDRSITPNLNTIRFAMSVKERETLRSFKEPNNRIKCYKLAKCLLKCFLPTLVDDTCEKCKKSLVSSYCLKNILLYMIDNHREDILWTDDALPNRVVELFSILKFCMEFNCGACAAFFTPYHIYLSTIHRYNPDSKMFKSIPIEGMTISDESFCPEDDKCMLPDIPQAVKEIFKEHMPGSRKIVQNYFDFMASRKWKLMNLVGRLFEMLVLLGISDADENDRLEMTESPGDFCLPFEEM